MVWIDVYCQLRDYYYCPLNTTTLLCFYYNYILLFTRLAFAWLALKRAGTRYSLASQNLLIVNCPWDQVLPQDIKHTDSWANGRSFILIIPKANQPLTLHDYYYIILLLLFLFSMYTCTCRCTIDVLLKMGTVAPYCQSLFLFSNCVPCSLFHSLAILKA